MPDLSTLADDVPPREDKKVLIGGPSSYGTQKILDSAYSGTDGVPANDTIVGVQNGVAKDHTYAAMRTLLDLYRCNLAVTPTSGQVLGVNSSGIVEAMEALLTALSANRYTAGYGLRANGVAMVDEFLPKIHPVSSAPASGLGYDGDYAIDFSANTIYKKGHTTAGTWDSASFSGGGVSPQGVIADALTLALTSGSAEEVEWDSSNATYTDSSWTYSSTAGDHYWSPPAAGTYEVEIGVTVIKSTTGRGDFRLLGYWDVSGGGTFAVWPSAFENDATTGDGSDADHSEAFASVTSFLALTTSSRVRAEVIAQTANQSIKAGTGYFKAKRVK